MGPLYTQRNSNKLEAVQHRAVGLWGLATGFGKFVRIRHLMRGRPLMDTADANPRDLSRSLDHLQSTQGAGRTFGPPAPSRASHKAGAIVSVTWTAMS